MKYSNLLFEATTDIPRELCDLVGDYVPEPKFLPSNTWHVYKNYTITYTDCNVVLRKDYTVLRAWKNRSMNHRIAGFDNYVVVGYEYNESFESIWVVDLDAPEIKPVHLTLDIDFIIGEIYCYKNHIRVVSSFRSRTADVSYDGKVLDRSDVRYPVLIANVLHNQPIAPIVKDMRAGKYVHGPQNAPDVLCVRGNETCLVSSTSVRIWQGKKLIHNVDIFGIDPMFISDFKYGEDYIVLDKGTGDTITIKL